MIPLFADTHTQTHTYTVDVCIFTLPLTNINTKVAFPALFVFNYVYLCKAQALTQTHVKAPHTDTTRLYEFTWVPCVFVQGAYIFAPYNSCPCAYIISPMSA